MSANNSSLLHGRYHVQRKLGEGGMGAVYLAYDMLRNRPVALKTCRPGSPEAVELFQRETAVLEKLSHPNLPRVFGSFSEGGGQFLVMEYIAGQDLMELLLKRGSLPESEVLGLVRQVGDALSYLHNLIPPVIHGDVKPHNIRVTAGGKATLVDFGLARMSGGGQSAARGKGTAPYAPVEQYEGRRIDARSDVYALGASMYVLLTAQLPPESVQRALGEAVLAPPRRLNPLLSANTERVVLQAMELLPRDRYQSVDDLLADLGA